jgi:hypothetical protein
MRIGPVALALALIPGCTSDGLLSANGVPARSFSLKVGQELDLVLQSLGPGEYTSPPLVSISAVEFLNVRLVTASAPAGMTQRFAFRAVRPGEAVITFQHTGNNPSIQDTVAVR